MLLAACLPWMDLQDLRGFYKPMNLADPLSAIVIGKADIKINMKDKRIELRKLLILNCLLPLPAT